MSLVFVSCIYVMRTNDNFQFSLPRYVGNNNNFICPCNVMMRSIDTFGGSLYLCDFEKWRFSLILTLLWCGLMTILVFRCTVMKWLMKIFVFLALICWGLMELFFPSTYLTLANNTFVSNLQWYDGN